MPVGARKRFGLFTKYENRHGWVLQTSNYKYVVSEAYSDNSIAQLDYPAKYSIAEAMRGLLQDGTLIQVPMVTDYVLDRPGIQPVPDSDVYTDADRWLGLLRDGGARLLANQRT